MAEKNLDISDHFPKDLRQLANAEFDLIINISGYPLPLDDSVTIKEWEVADPIGMDYEDHCGVRDQIERLVMDLILELRREKKAAR